VSALQIGLGLVVFLALVVPVHAQRYFYGNNYRGYGSFGPGYDGQPVLSENDARRVQMREERRERSERDARRREEERKTREAQAAQRRQNAYQPPPREEHTITMFGYEPRSPEEISQDMVLESRATAAAPTGPPPKPPKAIKGMLMVGVGDDIYYYKDGLFYTLNKEERPVRVDAPPEAIVFDLPQAARSVEIQGQSYYEYEGGWFTRVLMMGQVVYKVVPPPTE